MNKLLALWVVLCAWAAVAWCLPDHSVEQEAAHYCRMVWVHQHDARYGWPDFRRVYMAQCRADGTLNEEYVHGH